LWRPGPAGPPEPLRSDGGLPGRHRRNDRRHQYQGLQIGSSVDLGVKIQLRGRGSGGQPGDPAREARCGSCAIRARRRRAGGAVVAEPRVKRRHAGIRPGFEPVVCWDSRRLTRALAPLSGIAGRAGGRRVGEAGTRLRVHPQVERRPCFHGASASWLGPRLTIAADEEQAPGGSRSDAARLPHSCKAAATGGRLLSMQTSSERTAEGSAAPIDCGRE
jgi:hypothetical protein